MKVFIKRNGGKEKLNMVIKVTQEGDKENLLYRTVVEDMRMFLVKNGGAQYIPLPQQYLPDPGINLLVLDNVSCRGFKPAISLAWVKPGLDYEESVVSVSRLARLHAVSLCYRVGTRKDMLQLYPHLQREYCVTSSRVERVLKENAQLQSNINNQIKSANKQRLQQSLDTFGAVCLGEFCSDSFLFKYSCDLDSRLYCTDMVFQGISQAYYGSCVVDLLQFLFTSVASDVRRDFLNNLAFGVYYDNFAMTVKSVSPNFDLFSKNQFMKEFNDKLMFVFVFGITMFS